MKHYFLLFLYIVVYNSSSIIAQCNATPDGFCPSRIKCIMNNNEIQIDTFSIFIDSSKTIGNIVRKIDSAILDSLFWIQTNSTIQIKDPNTSLNISFPYKLKIGELNKFIISVKSKDTIGWLGGNITLRLFNDQSLTPLVLDKRIFNSIFIDSIPNIPISTNYYELKNAKDSVCSNFTPSSFIVKPINQSELDYKWTLNNKFVSSSNMYTFNESGILNLEIKLSVNQCLAKSQPKILYYENYPDSAILTIDPFETELRIKYFFPSQQKNYQTVWLKENRSYFGANVTDSSIFQPTKGLYTAILKGKVCEKKLGNINVNQGSLSLGNEFKNSLYLLENDMIKALNDISVDVYDLAGRRLLSKEISKNQTLDLKRLEKKHQILILNIYSEFYNYSFKLFYR